MSGRKGFVVAGTHSGCGKTSVALGLMGALARNGLRVQPFKCGPDFIDPGHHALASARSGEPVPSHNLDGWMLAPETNRALFIRHASDADVAVVEGVMGLFDGFSATNETGSTAQLAKMLDLPVILVVDARSMARSAAALVAGYAGFDRDLTIAGVIFNRVGSENHADLLREAMTLMPGIPVLGCLPRDESVTVPSRHLGLTTAEEEPDPALYSRLADWVAANINLDALLAALPVHEDEPNFEPVPPLGGVRIGLARDEAFCFYYEENLRLLRAAGARLVEFSPIRDRSLPEVDGLYFGGGYPELYAFELGQNNRLRRDIKAFCESGGPAYAECGGFMYLMDDIITNRGRYPMCGVFPCRAEMGDRFRALGYREITTTRDSLLGPAGTVARGHEFHYSTLRDNEQAHALEPIYAMSGRKGPLDAAEGFLSGNVLGSYVHLHFGSCPNVPAALVEACRVHSPSQPPAA